MEGKVVEADEHRHKMSAMVIWKRKALETGEWTDCVFLVGPDEQSAEKVHGNKFELRAASEYFEGLFRSPLTPPGPIRIKHLEPQTFRMVVEFAHFSHLFTLVENNEDAVKLARAADEFLMNDLGAESSALIEKFLTPENVWIVVEQDHMNTFVAAACKKLLSGKTLECLEQPTFLGIGQEALIFFLALEEMNIKSELDVISAVVKLVMSKTADQEEQRSVIRAALPYFRLLTVSPEQLLILSANEWLTDEEKGYLFQKCSLDQEKPQLPKNICPNLSSRSNMKTLTLIPECEQPLSARQIFDDLRCSRKVDDDEIFRFSFVAKKFVIIHGFDVVCKLNFASSFLNDLKKDGINAATCKLKLDNCTDVPYENNLDVSSSVSCSYPIEVHERNNASSTTDQFMTSSSVHFDMDATLVPKGGKFIIEVLMKGPCYYSKKYLAKLVKDRLQLNDIFGNLQMDNEHIDRSSHYGSPRIARDERSALCLVKSIFYSIV